MGIAAMNEFIPDKKSLPIQPPPDGVGGFGNDDCLHRRCHH
jgi:hypothetical protein